METFIISLSLKGGDKDLCPYKIAKFGLNENKCNDNML